MQHPMISTSWYSCLCIIPSQEWAGSDLLLANRLWQGGGCHSCDIFYKRLKSAVARPSHCCLDEVSKHVEGAHEARNYG